MVVLLLMVIASAISLLVVRPRELRRKAVSGICLKAATGDRTVWISRSNGHSFAGSARIWENQSEVGVYTTLDHQDAGRRRCTDQRLCP
jgi:hypothetical protein